MTAAIVIFFILIWLALMIFILGSTVLWVFMLIDVLKRTDWHDENEKVLWIVLLLVIGQIGAIAYYFVVRQPRGKAVPAAIPPTPEAPADQASKQ